MEKKQRKDHYRNDYEQYGLHISYFLEGTDCMIVKLHALNQTLVLQPTFFEKVLGISEGNGKRNVCGCKDISFLEASKLGFIFDKLVLENSEGIFTILMKEQES